MAVEAEYRVEGDVAPGFGGVADAFRRNFEKWGEVGAAVAVFHEGRKIVDLWGGFRDGTRRLPWEEDTMVMVFSSTKGVNQRYGSHGGIVELRSGFGTALNSGLQPWAFGG